MVRGGDRRFLLDNPVKSNFNLLLELIYLITLKVKLILVWTLSAIVFVIFGT